MLFLRLTTVGIGIFFAAVKWRTFVRTRFVPAHRQWRKLAEAEPEPGCQVGWCLAAHTTAHSRQPPPPTDFSLLLKDDAWSSPTQRMAPMTVMAVLLVLGFLGFSGFFGNVP